MTETQRGTAAAPGAVETSDAQPRRVVMVMGIFLATMVFGLAFAAVLLFQLNKGHAPSAGAQAESNLQPPPPRLQADPRAERVRIEAAARQRLAQGPVSIDRAMQDVVAKGWDR